MGKFALVLVFVLLFCGTALSQTKRNIIFAVINNGNTVEPIASVVNGKLLPPTSDDGAEGERKAFGDLYYKPKSKLNLIFGGATSGTVVIGNYDPFHCAY